MEFEGLTFLPMKRENVPALTAIMKRSFDDDSRLFFGKPSGGPPGYDDGSFLNRWAFHPHATPYCIEKGGVLIGALILFLDPQRKRGTLGTIFLDPDYIGQGLGKRAWRFVEHSYPEIRVWTTETPAVSYRNHRFYVNGCGFHVVYVDGGDDRFEAQFKLRKELP